VIGAEKPPYPGLRPFERDESHLFFGRDQCVDQMIARLAARRFLAVLGSSGTGKSSLVKTGLFSGLEMGLLSGAGSRWLIVEFRPGGHPLANLARALIAAESSATRKPQPDDAAVVELQTRFKREGPRELIKWCREGHLADGTNLLILVDQFEELFRYQSDDEREAAQALVSLLLESRWPRGVASPQASEVPIYVTITMRSEYLGACTLIQGLAEAINEGTFLTPRMTRQECEEAIVGPARVCGTDIEPRLVTRLLNDMADFAPWAEHASKDEFSRLARQADQLPLMQHALNRMWQRARRQRRDGEEITLRLAEYRGLEQELHDHAEEVLGNLDASGKTAAETVFRAVTTGTTVANAVRRPTTYGDLVKICGPESGDAVAAVMAAFGPRGCQFLTSDIRQTGERLPDDALIDISHESLIRQWTTLSTWLEKEGQAAHDWQRLSEVAEHGGRLDRRGLSNAIAFCKANKPTDAWAERYGGGRDRVERLINSSEWHHRRLIAGGAFAAVIGLALVGYLVYLENSRERQALAMEHQRAQSFANFELTVNSAQTLLNKLSTSVDRGEITVKGATDMLQVANDIVAQVHNIESTVKTIALLVNLKHTASDIYATLGNYTQAYDRAKEARDLVEPLRAADPASPQILQLLYHSIWRMGDAISARGGAPSIQREALAEYLEAQKHARRLLDMSPEDGARRRDLMFVHQKIGDVRQALGDLDAAMAEYRTALTLIQHASDRTPENRGWRRDVATTLRRIGQVHSGKNDFDGALQQLKAALEIITVLAQGDPNDNIIQSNLASNHRDIAVVYAQRGDLGRGDLDAALAGFRSAIAIQERLIARDPENATWQFSLAAFNAGLGGVLSRQGDLAGALERYRKAYALRQTLALKDPGNPGRQTSLAMAGISIADLLRAQKQNLDEAMKLYRAAIEILDEVRPRYDRNVFDCYIKIGDILILQSDREGALKEYKVAWAIARDSAARNSSSVIWQRSLATSYIKIGDVLTAQERAREALEQYQKALEIVMELMAKYPKSAEWPALVESLKAKIESLALKT
jgi:tetratricopeptide (TPR) repeat protein